ncbi:MAG: hypothetical protein ACR2J7_02655 [Luteimonas sp.]
MRQVFSSPRLENVEAVAELLRAQDIEVRITNGRGYRSGIRGNFSYRDNSKAGPTPAVWVLRADQQPQARQLLRDAGLLQSGRSPDDSFLPPNLQFGSDNISVDEKRQRSRLRYVLLAAVAAMVGLVLVTTRHQASTPATPASSLPTSAPASGPAAIAIPEAYVIATPPALAEMLFRRVLDAGRARDACLSIDGADPAAELLARLSIAGRAIRGASSCDASDDGLWIEARQYRTDGSGSGTVELVIRTVQAGRTTDTDRLQVTVEREQADWRVLDES